MYEFLYTYDVEDDEKPPVEAYLNPYALPLAYGVNTELLSYSLDMDESPFERMNKIVGHMLGDDNAELFVPIFVSDKSYNYATMTYTSGHEAYTNDSSEPKGRVTYTITSPVDGNVYCYFPSDYPRESELFVNGERISTYYGNETNRVFDLGFLKTDEVIRVELRMKDNDKLYIMNADTYFYYIDEDVFTESMNTLKESGYSIESFTEDSFSGTINIAAGDELVFTSIPYDKGWVIRVDGKKAETFEVLGATTGFYVTPGSHTLTMEYRPACFVYGGLISLCGLCAFVTVCIIDYGKRRKRKKIGG